MWRKDTVNSSLGMILQKCNLTPGPAESLRDIPIRETLNHLASSSRADDRLPASARREGAVHLWAVGGRQDVRLTILGGIIGL